MLAEVPRTLPPDARAPDPLPRRGRRRGRDAAARRAPRAGRADADGARHRCALPPKIAVHPRPDGSFVHAMPAHLGRDRRRQRRPPRDEVGRRVRDNQRAGTAGDQRRRRAQRCRRPACPIAILDGGPITAQRTAAVSGVAIAGASRRRSPAGRSARRSSAAGSRAIATSRCWGTCCRASSSPCSTATGACRGARRAKPGRRRDRRGTTAPHGTRRRRRRGRGRDRRFVRRRVRQVMTPDWLRPMRSSCRSTTRRTARRRGRASAALFLVDHREQFLANRDAGLFDGYPEPRATLGEAILGGLRRPAAGRVVVTHLGVGLADVVFADAIVRRARARSRRRTAALTPPSTA